MALMGGGVDAEDRSVEQAQRDVLVVFVGHDDPALCDDRVLLLSAARVGNKHALQRIVVVRDVVDVEHQAGKAIVEDFFLQPAVERVRVSR